MGGRRGAKCRCATVFSRPPYFDDCLLYSGISKNDLTFLAFITHMIDELQNIGSKH